MNRIYVKEVPVKLDEEDPLASYAPKYEAAVFCGNKKVYQFLDFDRAVRFSKNLRIAVANYDAIQSILIKELPAEEPMYVLYVNNVEVYTSFSYDGVRAIADRIASRMKIVPGVRVQYV